MAGSGTPGVPQWRKSTFSGEGNCVEVTALEDGVIGVRDSGHDDGVVAFSREDFRAFVLGVKAGEFDDLT